MEQSVRSSLLAIGAQFLRKKIRQQNESRTSTPMNESAAPATGPLLDPDTGEFTGSDDALIERCSLQGLLVRYWGRWQRRIVQTITFEDAQTHRRSMSIDVSGARLAVILDEWDVGRAPLYLPVSTGMLPGPILDIDARDGRGATLSIARRHENNEATTYQLLAVLIGRTPLRPAVHDSWMKVAAKTIYQYLKHQEKIPETVAKEFEQIEGMPDDIKNFAMSADFLNELDYLKHYYTLHVVYTPPRDDEHRVRDDVLKISWLERAARTRLGIGAALRSVLVPGPWPYAIDLPLLTGSKHGGTHIRLIAPEDLEIGRLALAFGDQEIPLLPQSTGSASDSRPYTTPQTLSDDHSNPAVELTRDRRQAEILIHPRALTDLENRIIKKNTPDSSQWVMTATFNPGHHKFLLPAAINLIATVALLCLAHHFSWGIASAPAGTASTPAPSTAFLSMIPPLVTMYFASPREHAIAGQFHAFGRMLVTLSAGIALLYAALETYDTSRTSMHCLPLGHPLDLCAGARTSFAVVISVCCLSILYLVVLMVSVNASHIDAFRLRKNLAAARDLLPEEQKKSGALFRRRCSLYLQGVISMIFMMLLVRRNFDAPPPRIRRVIGVDIVL